MHICVVLIEFYIYIAYIKFKIATATETLSNFLFSDDLDDLVKAIIFEGKKSELTSCLFLEISS
jgi:hypothetical protein